ncbi:hypothetical protein J6590_099373, partial [Homalodisca vitripennis]
MKTICCTFLEAEIAVRSQTSHGPAVNNFCSVRRHACYVDGWRSGNRRFDKPLKAHLVGLWESMT